MKGYSVTVGGIIGYYAGKRNKISTYVAMTLVDIGWARTMKDAFVMQKIKRDKNLDFIPLHRWHLAMEHEDDAVYELPSHENPHRIDPCLIGIKAGL